MIFTSIDFIVFFVFVLAAIAIIKHRKFQHLILIGGSYYFFYFSSNYLIVLLIFSTILDFYLAKIIYNTENVFRKKLLLIISLGGSYAKNRYHWDDAYSIKKIFEDLKFVNDLEFLNIV